MKKRPILLTVVCVLLALAGLFALNSSFRQYATLTGLIIYTDLTKPNDPASRAIRNGPPELGSTVSLTPKPFAVGTTEADILATLKKAKYKPDPDKTFSWRSPKTFPAGSLFFEKSVEGLPCSVHYEVVVRFDSQQRLVEAWGTEDEAGCL